MAFQQISDRLPLVKTKLGEKTGIDTKIHQWIRDAFIEFAMATPFEELLSSKDQTTTTGATLGTDDIYDYPDNCRAIKSIHMLRTDGSSYELRRKNTKYLDKYNTNSTGPPTIYAPWSVQPQASFKRQIIVRPMPGATVTYTLRWRFWQMPIIDGTLADTYLTVPLDWLEIIDYGAAMRGFQDLLMFDRAMITHAFLYGGYDPETHFKTPGIIKQRMTAMIAESEAEEYGIRPRLSGYTNTHGGR
ncbi:hypothetical protein LCGC14_3159280 [marine sediment metagenome]|uniref:Uncharacterized protein n=1 Tax=marine sediment metagenome TaxID=412755 RepID=A0A0F8VRQ5_9ZZZZ